MRIRDVVENVPVVDIGTSLTPNAVDASEPRNLLIIGVDDAAGLDKDDPVLRSRTVGSQLADVIMIMRVDPRDHSVKLLSIPRDTRVELPSGRMGRINVAMAGVGGEANLVRTIKRNFGIQIDNYVQLDFLGFRKLVEVLGGVPVYFTTPVRDRNSGLAIEEAGCRVLDPEQALAYARARHFYFYEDGKWRADGTGDLGRITRQQDFIKRALRTAAQRGFRNPTTALGVVNAAASAVRMDNTLDVGSIVALVREFQDFNPDAIESMQVPTRFAPRGGVAYQDVVWEETGPLLELFRNVPDPADPEPGGIIVEVSRTTDDPDTVDLAALALDNAGFDADTWPTRMRSMATTVSYGPAGREAAIRLAAQLVEIPEFSFDESMEGYQVRLSIGRDFAGVRTESLPLDQLPSEFLPELLNDPNDRNRYGDDANGTRATTGPRSDAETTPGSSDVGQDDDGGPSEQRVDDERDPSGQDSEPDVGSPGVVPTDPEASALCR